METTVRGSRARSAPAAQSPHATVIRPRLFERIGQPDAAITLITAPAGYGKSTLLAQWRDSAATPVAWIRIGIASNSLVSLLDTIGMEVANALYRDGDPPVRTVDNLLDWLHALSDDGERLTLIFDDYHLIANQAVHEALDTLIALRPSGISLIVSSRTEVPLALGRLRAAGQVRQLTAADLAFTADETTSVAGQAQIPLTHRQIVTLGERTEGWIAGIRLALLSLEHVATDAVESVVDTWSATRWLDDYVVEEVLATLPDDVRDFVERTTMLAELTPELCDAVLESTRSADLLNVVATRLVFVRATGAPGGALAYHPLFAESVERIVSRRRTSEELSEAHRRAAVWFAGQGSHEAAIEHGVRAEAWDLVEDEVRIVFSPLADGGQHYSLLYWLGKLPTSRMLADSLMAFRFVQSLQFTGQIREARRWFDLVEPTWMASGDPWQLGHAAECRTFFFSLDGNPDASLRNAYVALGHTPIERTLERMYIWGSIIQTEFFKGNEVVVAEAYRQADRCHDVLPNQSWLWLLIEPDRANHHFLRGRLRDGAELCRHVIAHVPTSYATRIGRVRFRLAAVELEWNHLDAAMDIADLVEEDMAWFPVQLWYP
ncbi:MAG TPA: hypothetical protein VFQ54_00290, partial [Thermomicrobiales bacterium]|nr:hypothetical protein [Thermomicrobiales bacterium]